MSAMSYFCKAQLPMPRVNYYGEKEGYYPSSITDVKTDDLGLVWVISAGHVTKFNGHNFRNIKTSGVAHSAFMRFYTRKGKSPFVTDYNGRVFFVEDDTLRAYAYNDTLSKLNIGRSHSDIHFDEYDNLHVSFRGIGYRILKPDGHIRAPILDGGKSEHLGFTAILREGQLPFISIEAQPIHPSSTYMMFSLLSEDLEIRDSIYLQRNAIWFPQSVIRLPNNNYLLSTGSGHLIEFNHQEIIGLVPYNFTVIHLFKDKKDGIWIATRNNGLHYYKAGIIEESNRRTFSSEGFAAATTQDPDGGIWAHSDAKGLMHIPNPEHYYYQLESKLPSSGRPCKMDLIEDDLIAAASDGSLSILHLANHSQERLKEPLEDSKMARSVLYDSAYHRTWIATTGNLYYSHQGTWKTLNTKGLDRVHSASRFTIKRTANPKYSFIGIHERQVFLVSDTTITYISPVSPYYPISAAVVNDSLWFSGEGRLFLAIGNVLKEMDTEFPKLKNKSVNYIVPFGNTIFLAARPGGIYTIAKGRLSPFELSGEQLSHGTLYKQNSGKMWLLSLAGNFLIEKAMDNKISPWSISSYQPFSLGSGTLPVCNHKTMYWGLPNNKILQVDFKDMKSHKIRTPILRFSKLEINRAPVPIDNNTYHIGYDERHIQIEYEGLSYQEGSLLFRYQLTGYETDWTETSNQSIQYTTLPSGNYSFEVQTKRKTGFWSNSKLLHFKVAPPYWQTWWFISGCSLLVLLIVYIIASTRIRVIRREQQLVIDRLKAEQNALQAQMDPHFVFNILSSVQYLVLESSKDRVITFLNMFSGSLRNTLDQTRKSSIPIKHEIQFLKEYMEMERFRFEDKFDFEILQEFDNSFLQHTIPPFIIQPFVENAIQHGLKSKKGKGHLVIRFREEGKFYKVVVNDNGVGREAAGRFKNETGPDTKKSHGVDIISKRLALYNGRKDNVFITDLLGENEEALGTEVLLFIKKKDV